MAKGHFETQNPQPSTLKSQPEPLNLAWWNVGSDLVEYEGRALWSQHLLSGFGDRVSVLGLSGFQGSFLGFRVSGVGFRI